MMYFFKIKQKLLNMVFAKIFKFNSLYKDRWILNHGLFLRAQYLWPS